jgi:hypothetical protein
VCKIWYEMYHGQFSTISKKGKDIPGSLYGFDVSRGPYFLENRLTDSGEFITLKLLPRFTPRKISATRFC